MYELIQRYGENEALKRAVGDMMKKLANLKKAMKSGLMQRMTPEALRAVVGIEWNEEAVRVPPELTPELMLVLPVSRTATKKSSTPTLKKSNK